MSTLFQKNSKKSDFFRGKLAKKSWQKISQHAAQAKGVQLISAKAFAFVGLP